MKTILARAASVRWDGPRLEATCEGRDEIQALMQAITSNNRKGWLFPNEIPGLPHFGATCEDLFPDDLRLIHEYDERDGREDLPSIV